MRTTTDEVHSSYLDRVDDLRGDAGVSICRGGDGPAELLKGTRLLNLRADPSESRDLTKEHPEAAQRPKKIYADWSKEVASASRSPNIVLFLVDDMGLMDTSVPMLAGESGKPFFLYMSYYAVHAPFNSDPRFAAHYRDRGRSKVAQAYATLIEGLDKSLADLMDHLEAKGIAENTLILFLGDNGGDAPLAGTDDISSSAPLRGRKGSKWEGGVRVPFIAAWAKPAPNNKWQKKLPVVAGSIRQEIGACYDLFPTIADLVDVHELLHGA